MSKIGILAYGSLIEDPGKEIEPLITERIDDVQTPFNIEFARTSSSRDGAPTVIPVQKGGSPAKNAKILVLDRSITSEKATDLLWRRETRNEASEKSYKRRKKPTANHVVVEELKGFCNLDCVLYTKIGANIESPTAEKLAELAIISAQSNAGEKGEDGISYLLSLKRQKITTPLMPGYEKHVLESLGVKTLDDALNVVRKNIEQNVKVRSVH